MVWGFGFTKAAFTRQTKVGKFVLANSSWFVWTAQKQSANTLANCWRQIELVSILANFFSMQRFRVGKLVFDVWTVCKHVLLTINQSKHALCSRDLRDTSQNGGRT